MYNGGTFGDNTSWAVVYYNDEKIDCILPFTKNGLDAVVFML